MRRRIVSSGYDARPAPIVTLQPRRKDARKEPSSAPTRTVGSAYHDQREHEHGTGPIRTKRVVDTEVETTVDDDTNDGRDEATVKTGDTVRRKRLAVDVHKAVELARSSALGRLVVVRETRTRIVEGVDEEEGRSTSGTTGRDVATEPLPVAIGLLEAEERLEVVLYARHVSNLSRARRAMGDALKAKLSAWVGKYRMTLAVLPRQRETTPSSA
jgi:hypothetical protein